MSGQHTAHESMTTQHNTTFIAIYKLHCAHRRVHGIVPLPLSLPLLLSTLAAAGADAASHERGGGHKHLLRAAAARGDGGA